MVDQRLNPTTVFVLDNSSTGSLGTVDDSRDYHRPLNVSTLSHDVVNSPNRYRFGILIWIFDQFISMCRNAATVVTGPSH
jgi:hypothetical protein